MRMSDILLEINSLVQKGREKNVRDNVEKALSDGNLRDVHPGGRPFARHGRRRGKVQNGRNFLFLMF